MTIGGTSWAANRVTPIAGPKKGGVGARETGCQCVPGLLPISASVSAADPFQSAFSFSGDLCAKNMAVRATVTAFIGSGPGCFVRLTARDDNAGASYNFLVTDIGGGNATYELWVPNTFTTLLDTVTLAKPVNGDLLELSVFGPTITGKKNGSTILSATNSSVTIGPYAGVELFDQVTVANLEVDISC